MGRFWTEVVYRIAATGCLAVALVAGAVPAGAQDSADRKYYGVSISGFPIGHVEYTARQSGGEYQVQGFLGSSGFFGLFIATRYSGAVIGEVRRGGALRPSAFRGRYEARRQFAQVDIRYRGNQPASVEHLPPRPARPDDVAPADARGALDPISALYLLLRDMDRDDVCKLDTAVFEGVRLSRVTLGTAEAVGTAIRCNGNYARQGGFSDAQLAERRNYPFLLEYTPGADGRYRVSRFLATTEFGVARATLRDR